MINKTRPIIIAAVFSLCLFACGGGGGKNPLGMNFDFGQPRVMGSNPLSFTTITNRSQPITVLFSKKMDAMKTMNAFSLYSTKGKITGFFFWDPTCRLMTFQPSSSLEGSSMYTLAIDTSAEDVEGNDLAQQYVAVFYVDADLTPPTIISHSPADNFVGVLPSANVTITFSEPIDPQSVYSGITISPSVQGTFSLDLATRRIVTFNPTYDLSFGTTYTVSVSDAIKDVNGNALQSTESFSFTVGDDFIKPEIASVRSYDGDDNLSLTWDENLTPNQNIEKNKRIVITFSEKVKPANLASAITISPAASFYITLNNQADPVTIATINFTSPLESEKNYTLAISSIVSDLQNNRLVKDYSYKFYTNGSHSLAPRIDSISDSFGTWNHSVTQQISPNPAPDKYNNVFLNFPAGVQINPVSVQVSLEHVLGDSGGVNPLIVNPDWPAPQYTRYRFDMNNVIVGNTYKITVKGGPSGLKDQYGNYMKEDYVQYFCLPLP